MKEMISKELLSEVLGKNVKLYLLRNDEKVYVSNSNQLRYYTGILDDTNWINIYELAHKCKEWANTCNAVILSWCRGTPG